MARAPSPRQSPMALAAACVSVVVAAGVLIGGCATGPQRLTAEKLAVCVHRPSQMPESIEGFRVVYASTNPVTGALTLELWDPEHPGRRIDKSTRRRIQQQVAPCPIAKVESTTRPPAG